MKMIYLDTSIIISFLKKDDIFHNSAEKIMGAKNLEKIGSVITIVEIYSVISRQFDNLQFDSSTIQGWETLNHAEKITSITLFFMDQLSMRFYVCLGNEKILVQNQNFNIQIDFSRACRIAPLFPLRALDNLQIACTLNIRDIKDIEIDYFVTTDEIILNNAKNIKDLTDLTIIHPDTLIEIENL